MSYPVFLGEFGAVAPGDRVRVTGAEARHAVSVRRIGVGEVIRVADGRGRAVQGSVVVADRAELVVEVGDVLAEGQRGVRLVAVQALAKGDRSDLAVELLTELGADEIVAWSASRSVVVWQGERGEKSLAKWAMTAREAAKQSRRFSVPEVTHATTKQVIARCERADLVLVLHEEATRRLVDVVREWDAPDHADIVLITGPEGGISPVELDAFVAAGGVPVLLTDNVLRTSTAGGVALAQLQAVIPG